MKFSHLQDYTRGWLIGDFEPSLMRTSEFEIGVLTHKKNEVWPAHYHKVADEYNVLVSGSMLINNTLVEPGTVFHVEKGEVAHPQFLEDCVVVVIKTPSVIGDKYVV